MSARAAAHDVRNACSRNLRSQSPADEPFSRSSQVNISVATPTTSTGAWAGNADEGVRPGRASAASVMGPDNSLSQVALSVKQSFDIIGERQLALNCGGNKCRFNAPYVSRSLDLESMEAVWATGMRPYWRSSLTDPCPSPTSGPKPWSPISGWP